MSYSKPTKATIPTPPHADQAFCENVVANFTNHFAQVLTPELMIAHNKGCYATVINATSGGQPLEQLVGTANASEVTKAVLNGISARYSAVPQS